MKVDSYVQQGLRKQLAPPHHWQVGNVPWQMGKYCLQWSVQFYAEMQAAMVNLEIFSKIVSWWEQQNKYAALAARNREETEEQHRKKRRVRVKKKTKKKQAHFLMMKDEESRYQRKQYCKHSPLPAQFSKKGCEKPSGTRDCSYLLSLLTDFLYPVGSSLPHLTDNCMS